MENRTPNELNLCPRLHFGLPSIDFWQDGVVWLVRPSRASQIFHIWLNTRGCQSRKCRGHVALVHTAFHGGDKFCITGSFVGGSFRICDIQACHSGGIWVALKSCYENSGQSGCEEWGRCCSCLCVISPPVTTYAGRAVSTILEQ
jgi:hypothetical protein